MYKRTIGAQVHEEIPVYGDLGYLGIGAYHANSKTLRKASKVHRLDDKGKTFNKRLARKRIVVEHMNGKIKTYKSMAYAYRNHCEGIYSEYH
jgi:hypothetical protein